MGIRQIACFFVFFKNSPILSILIVRKNISVKRTVNMEDSLTCTQSCKSNNNNNINDVDYTIT